MDNDLGARFWLKAVGLIIGGGILMVICWLLISGLFMRFGFIVAIVVVFGALGLVAHRFDKKKERQYAEDAAKY